jgi:hypothetical protein
VLLVYLLLIGLVAWSVPCSLAAIVSCSAVVVAASILARLLSISGWNLAFANQTAKALAPTIELIVIASISMLRIKAFEFINAYFMII